MYSYVHFFPLIICLHLVSGVTAQSTDQYIVVTNDEGLHAAWSTDSELPAGWSQTGFKGTLEQCSDHIHKVWTDMRPLSFQKKYKKNKKDGYVVIINHEEQYMIWPRDEYVPDGWDLAGAGGSYQVCSAYIRKTWTDMRPLSLRQRLDD